MNWVDGVILVTFAIYLAEGLRRGFIEQLLELIGFFVTIFLALWTYQPLSRWLVDNVGVQQTAADPIAFLLDWVFLQVLFSLALKYAYPLIPEKIRNASTNRVAGTVPAFLKAVIIIAVLLTVIAILPVPERLKNSVNDSIIGSRFVAQSSEVESVLNRIFGRDIKKSLTFLTVPAQNEEIIAPDERVDLKFTTEAVKADPVSEQQMLKLVNIERAKVGLSALVWDEEAAIVARAHSIDMFKRGYFSHENPDGLSPFDRMEKAKLSYTAAGENLAYAASVDLAHAGLMRSPGHRANILEKDFGRIGIGVIDGGIYGKMFTQNFRD